MALGGLVRVIGDRGRTGFWTDPWVGDEPLVCVFLDFSVHVLVRWVPLNLKGSGWGRGGIGEDLY